MQAKRARAAAPSAPQTGAPDDDDENVDMDALRNGLARRVHQLIGTQTRRWCTCRERSCKRLRECLAPRGVCSNAEPVGEVSEEQRARTMAQFQRMVREHIARQDAAQPAQKTDKSHKKS